MSHNLDHTIYDMKTVTINDFAVEIELSPEQIQYFYRENYVNDPNISDAVQLSVALQTQIEEMLCIDQEETNQVNYEIASIELVFDFVKLIPMLEKRGHAISNRDWDKVEGLNLQINDYMQSSQGKHELC